MERTFVRALSSGDQCVLLHTEFSLWASAYVGTKKVKLNDDGKTSLNVSSSCCS